MRSELKIVPATLELVKEFAGKPPPFTFKGHAGLLDGKVVGLGGIFFRDDVPVIFAEFTPGLARKHRAQAFRFLQEEFDKWTGLLFAICDSDFDSAPGLLDRLGFKPTAQPPWWVREA